MRKPRKKEEPLISTIKLSNELLESIFGVRELTKELFGITPDISITTPIFFSFNATDVAIKYIEEITDLCIIKKNRIIFYAKSIDDIRMIIRSIQELNEQLIIHESSQLDV